MKQHTSVQPSGESSTTSATITTVLNQIDLGNICMSYIRELQLIEGKKKLKPAFNRAKRALVALGAVLPGSDIQQIAIGCDKNGNNIVLVREVI